MEVWMDIRYLSITHQELFSGNFKTAKISKIKLDFYDFYNSTRNTARFSRFKIALCICLLAHLIMSGQAYVAKDSTYVCMYNINRNI